MQVWDRPTWSSRSTCDLNTRSSDILQVRNEPDEAWEVPKRDCWTNTLLLHSLRKERCNSRSDQVDFTPSGKSFQWIQLPWKAWSLVVRVTETLPKALGWVRTHRRWTGDVERQWIMKGCHSWLSHKLVMSSQIRWERRNFPEGEKQTSFIQ